MRLDDDPVAEYAGKRLIEANLAVVVSIAESCGVSGIHVLDLIQNGNDGLLLALKTFSGKSSESFSAHAATCINDAIAKTIAKERPTRE